jgi:protein-tyrosine phosphatase
MRILFVCTGNICRSPTAHAVLSHLVRGEQGLPSIFVDSAGTHGYHVGDPPDPRAVAVAAAAGVDMRGQRARRFDNGGFETFDLLVAMDSGHQRHLEALAKGNLKHLEKIVRFTAFLGDRDGQVRDPYYGTMADFEAVYAQIDQGCRAMIAHWKKETGQ